MQASGAARALALETLDDPRLLELVQTGDSNAFRLVMQRHNRRLYRVARGVLGDDAEAEDVVQETYVKAFENLRSFRGESSLATWLTRIVLNEALGRKRKHRPMRELSDLDLLDEQGRSRLLVFPGGRGSSNPETEANRAEVRRLLERAIDDLPEAFRLVFVLRDIEQMSVEETAAQLKVRPETVKTRLHRARLLLRQALEETLGSALEDMYTFDGQRCERLTENVLRRVPPVQG
jgi:RNA polymerase sigma-70 factor (ECF subfamily)